MDPIDVDVLDGENFTADTAKDKADKEKMDKEKQDKEKADRDKAENEKKKQEEEKRKQEKKMKQIEEEKKKRKIFDVVVKRFPNKEKERESLVKANKTHVELKKIKAIWRGLLKLLSSLNASIVDFKENPHVNPILHQDLISLIFEHLKARASENPSKPSPIVAEEIDDSEDSEMEGWETDGNDGDFVPHTRKKTKTRLKVVSSGVSKGSIDVGGEGSSKCPKGKTQKDTLKVSDSFDGQDSLNQTHNVEASSCSHCSENNSQESTDFTP
ncbi:uncharacterized protein LOC131858443 [Cryptomeria japonica]|uniref:uncharacterized protein LOC131858443 n=1 Tax=Cryptomeria japonica TaxID=3369 RepID=UPI0027DA9554|nr:uncharacterized protein LOC131858443 [Cryptomeria japonica]